MPRYKLTIAYDGTDFHGWQKQEPPDPSSDPALGEARPRVVLRTVQDVLQRAVRGIVREPVIISGASRTDAGVHARAQVAAFTCSDGQTDEPSAPPGDEAIPSPRHHGGWPISRGTDRLLRAVNSRLPGDVVVMVADAVPDSFDPIVDCTAKAYSYTLHFSPRGLPPLWDRRYVQQVFTPLDAARMNEAAALLVGEHDFAAFAAAGHNRATTIRTVHSLAVIERTLEDGSLRYRIDIAGSGFLWNMVRIIAGTLLEVGRGRLSATDVARALETRNRRAAGPTLPPTGLCLEWIRYERPR